MLTNEFKNYKRNYYRNKFKREAQGQLLEELGHHYVNALQWVLDYYYRGVQSWDWYYPFHYAPFISDLKNIEQVQIDFQLGTPFLPFQVGETKREGKKQRRHRKSKPTLNEELHQLVSLQMQALQRQWEQDRARKQERKQREREHRKREQEHRTREQEQRTREQEHRMREQEHKKREWEHRHAGSRKRSRSRSRSPEKQRHGHRRREERKPHRHHHSYTSGY